MFSGAGFRPATAVIPAQAWIRFPSQPPPETALPKLFCVYILASKLDGTLYTGVTSDLVARIHQHRTGAIPGFTKRYNIKLLVYFEVHESAAAAITREKQIKEWPAPSASSSSRKPTRIGMTSTTRSRSE